jgi:methylmalonyl-CoA mutase cobalamin-binding domain/chain
MIVEAALQEDVEVVGLSILSGAHMTLLPKVAAQLREAGLGHCVIIAGGIIPAEDSVVLTSQHGIDAIYCQALIPMTLWHLSARRLLCGEPRHGVIPRCHN